jgi:hypothetical protein
MTSGISSKLIGITAAAALAITAPDVQAQDTPSTSNPSQDTSQLPKTEHVETAPQDSINTDVPEPGRVDFDQAPTDNKPITSTTRYHAEADFNGRFDQGIKNELMRTSITKNYQGIGENDFNGSLTVLNDYRLSSDDAPIPAEQKIGSVIGSISSKNNDDGWTGSNLIVFNSGNPLDAPYVESSTTLQISDDNTTFKPTIQAGVNGQSIEDGVPQETYGILNTSLDQQISSEDGRSTDFSAGGLVGRWGENLANDARTFLNAEAGIDVEDHIDDKLISDTEIYAGAFSNAGTEGGVVSYRSESIENGRGSETGMTVFGQQKPDGTVYGKAKIAFGEDTDPQDAAEGIAPTSYGTGASVITSTLTRPQLFPPKIPHTVQNGDYTAEAEVLSSGSDDAIHADIVVGHQRDLGNFTVGAAVGPSYTFSDDSVDPGVEGVFNVDYHNDSVSLGLETQVERDGDIEPYAKFTYTP